MITKGTEEYRMAGELARKLYSYANTSTSARYERAAREAMVDRFRIGISIFCDGVESLNVFASNIAKTVNASTRTAKYQAAFMSEKQAWCLACAAIEGGVDYSFFIDNEDED